MTGKIGLYKCKNGTKIEWRVRWYGQYDSNTGKPKRYSRTFPKKKDAEKFRDEKKSDFRRGTPRDQSKVTLKEYTERWLRNKVKIEGIRLGTQTLYQETLDRLYEYFGTSCLVRNIDRQKAENFLSDLKPKMKSKTELSDWSRNRILRQCKTIFNSAVQHGATSVNPFAGIKGAKCITSKWYYLKEAEYLKLQCVTRSLTEKVLYALCYTAGLRETEALTLRWVDVDFENGVINVVNQSPTDNLPPFEIKDTDERTIPIPKHTINLLTLLQAESPDGSPYILTTGERFERVVRKWKQCQQTGKAWSYRYWAYNIPRNFNLRIKWAGIKTDGKKLTVHILRKCCIQNWQNDLPMTYVMYLAGHADTTTTERYYSTVDKSRFSDISKSVDKRLDDAKISTTDLFLTFSTEPEEKEDAESQELRNQVVENERVMK